MSEDETKQGKFLRLADKRIPKALDAMRLVTQLASPNYEVPEGGADEIKAMFTKAVEDMCTAFGTPIMKPVDNGFNPGGEGWKRLEEILVALNKGDPMEALELTKKMFTS
ncbi:MAG: hypothetical protein JKY54_19770 [Flavobacteriales bacterium]|nr:hypothetical protein [Flavobacteriales bacterium]